jgi:DNA end-binding protein Ku
VGYQRINKRTGKVVEWGDIVKGYEYKKGEYVALSEEDFRQANVKASQTIEITSFTKSTDIAPEYYENPYYLIPTKGGEKGYALLRETLLRTDKVAVGSIVMRGRQHFGVLGADKRVLLFNTVRFAAELRSLDDLAVAPASAKAANVSSKEVAMAEKLIEEMSAPWKPNEYHDTYREDLMRRIDEKVRKHQTHVLTAKEKAPKEGRKSAEVIDLMAVLKKSLESRAGTKHAAAPASGSRRRRS